MPTTTRAQVMWEPNQWWDPVEPELDDPGDHEALIRFEASGPCHSADHVRIGGPKLDEPTSNRYRPGKVSDGDQDPLDGKNIRGVVLQEL